MPQQLTDSASEVKRLQRCMNELVSVLALPAVWSGSEPNRILETFLDALLKILDLDFLYVRARIDSGGAPIEMLRATSNYAVDRSEDEIRQALSQWLAKDAQRWTEEVSIRVADQELQAFPMQMGLEGELGLVVAVSERIGFPEQTEKLILSVAANQTALALQQALRLSEQRRVASELERRVAKRTRELAEANEELQLQVGLLQRLPVSAWTLRPDGTADFVNQVWLDYSGQTFDFVRSHPEAWMTAVHPDDRDTASRSFWEGVRSGQGFAFETRSFRARDGVYRWHLNQAVVLRDPEGKVVRFVGTTTDIDDQKRAEEELRASEANLRRVIDTIPTVSWCNLPDGPNEFLSKGWHDYTGMSPEEAQGWGWSAAFHPDDLPPLMKRWQELLVSGEPGEIEARIRRHDGEYRWFLIRVAPFHDETGTILRWYGTSTDIHDRKLADEALRASENNLRQIVDSIPGLVCTMDPTGEIQHLNQPLLEYFGKTPEELKGWKMTDAVHPDDLPGVIAAYTHSVATGTPYDIEHRCRRVDGVYRWFQVRALAVHDASNNILGWYVLLTDIEDRKLAEEELKRSEASYRVVVETASDAVVSMDDQGLIVFANPATARIFGYDPAELVGKPLTILMPEYMRALHKTGFNSYLATSHRHMNWQGVELIALRKNGEEFPVEISFGEVTRDEHKTFTGFLRDISKRKKVERALRRSEAFLAEGQHLGQIGSYSWRVATDEITWSAELYRIYEFEIGVPVTLELIRTRVHPGDISLIEKMKMVDQAREGGHDFEWQNRLMMPDGSIKYIHAVARATRDQDGQLEYIAAVQDVTARRLAEEARDKARSELTHVDRVMSLGTMTASIAHELNQPLSGIVTNAGTCIRMLAANPPNIDGALETARRTIRDGNRASEVLTRLRALFTKKDAANESVNLNEVTGEVIALSLSDLHRNRVILQQKLADYLPLVMGDRVQLQQVILNLLRNGSDAMETVDDRPRQLLIRTETDNNCVLVSVQDSGVGFDPQITDRLFESFFTTKQDGMGIGLSVSRSIVEAHNGKLWATRNDGPGATFAFSIPCDDALTRNGSN
jgi:PAS domain S-box-containing protein